MPFSKCPKCETIEHVSVLPGWYDEYAPKFEWTKEGYFLFPCLQHFKEGLNESQEKEEKDQDS